MSYAAWRIARVAISGETKQTLAVRYGKQLSQIGTHSGTRMDGYDERCMKYNGWSSFGCWPLILPLILVLAAANGSALREGAAIDICEWQFSHSIAACSRPRVLICNWNWDSCLKENETNVFGALQLKKGSLSSHGQEYPSLLKLCGFIFSLCLSSAKGTPSKRGPTFGQPRWVASSRRGQLLTWHVSRPAHILCFCFCVPNSMTTLDVGQIFLSPFGFFLFLSSE